VDGIWIAADLGRPFIGFKDSHFESIHKPHKSNNFAGI